MMEIDITLDQIPEHILEEIFSFVHKNADLRLVCKTFKNIIDNSAKLMKDQWLVVYKTLEIDSSTIHQYYQKLKFNKLEIQEIIWMHNYQHKNRIKAIKIRYSEKDHIRTAFAIHNILLNFNSLEMLRFSKNFWNVQNDQAYHIRMIPDKMSKLTTLILSFCSNEPNNALEMFSNIPTIKKIVVYDFFCMKFPDKVEWKLEELIIQHIPSTFRMIDESVMPFLISQQSSLKKLCLPYCSDFADFIMRNLPNLENLIVSTESYEDVDDTLLISNDQLQRLSILDKYTHTKNNVLETILNHYNKIKYLNLASDFTEHKVDYKRLSNMKLENLTHLLLNGQQTFPFLNANMPNIEVLAITSDEDYDFTQISNESMKNIKKLSLDLSEEKEAFSLLLKCPNLTELNIHIGEWDGEENGCFDSSINKMLAIVPKVKLLSISSVYNADLLHNELLNQISKKNIILRTFKEDEYEYFTKWIGEDFDEDECFTLSNILE